MMGKTAGASTLPHMTLRHAGEHTVRAEICTRLTYRRTGCDDVSCSRFPHAALLYYVC